MNGFYCTCANCNPIKKYSINDIARLVLHTADTMERMFNKELYKLQVESEKRKYGDKYDEWMLQDPSRFYHLTQEAAAEHSCKFLNIDTKFARLIDLSLEWWNDTILWAEDILGISSTEYNKIFDLK